MNVCGRPLDDAIFAKAVAEADGDGCPRGLAVGLVIVESSGVAGACGDLSSDPRAYYCAARGAYACSWGLLQLSACGGQGTGMTLAQLTDPDTNLRVGVPPLAAAYGQYGGPTLELTDWWTVLQASGHPGWTADPDLVALWAPAVDFVACAVQQLDLGLPPPTGTAIVTITVLGASGGPLSGATVTLTGAGGGTRVTDAAGHATFTALAGGPYSYLVTATSYEPATGLVSVSAGGTAQATVVVTPAAGGFAAATDLGPALIAAGGIGLLVVGWLRTRPGATRSSGR